MAYCSEERRGCAEELTFRLSHRMVHMQIKRLGHGSLYHFMVITIPLFGLSEKENNI